MRRACTLLSCVLPASCRRPTARCARSICTSTCIPRCSRRSHLLHFSRAPATAVPQAALAVAQQTCQLVLRRPPIRVASSSSHRASRRRSARATCATATPLSGAGARSSTRSAPRAAQHGSGAVVRPHDVRRQPRQSRRRPSALLKRSGGHQRAHVPAALPRSREEQLRRRDARATAMGHGVLARARRAARRPRPPRRRRAPRRQAVPAGIRAGPHLSRRSQPLRPQHRPRRHRRSRRAVMASRRRRQISGQRWTRALLRVRQGWH